MAYDLLPMAYSLQNYIFFVIKQQISYFFYTFARMKKVKYYYDPDTLSYKRILSRKRTKVRNALIFLTAAALFGILFSFIMINSRLFFTPREVVLAREIKTYETNYQILNKKMELAEDVLADLEERDNNMYRLYFNAPIIPDSVRKSLKDPNRYKNLEKYGNSKLVANTNKRLDILRKQLVVQSKSLDEIAKLSKAKEKLGWNPRKTSFKELVRIMVEHDMKFVRKLHLKTQMED